MDETLKAAGGKVWTPDEPAGRTAFTISFTTTPPRKRDFLVAWWEEHYFKVGIIVFSCIMGSISTAAMYESFTRPVISQTEEGELFVPPNISSAAAVATVRDWVPQQEPFLLTPDEIKNVSLNDVTNGELGFITLKDGTVIPFTIHNLENIVTVTPDQSVSLAEG